MCLCLHILIVVLALTIQTTAGIKCFSCTYTWQSRWCMNPENNENDATTVNCDRYCGVKLAEFGDMGKYEVGIKSVIMQRGCQFKECFNDTLNCCSCNYDKCNADNTCGMADIVSPTILFVIGGFFICTMLA